MSTDLPNESMESTESTEISGHVATVVVVRHNGVSEEQVDASPMSPFARRICGGRPTFLGSWQECDAHPQLVLMGPAEPDDQLPDVPERLLPPEEGCHGRREPGPLKGPLVFIALVHADNDEHPPDVVSIDTHSYVERFGFVPDGGMSMETARRRLSEY